jgi:hypothetical protein
LALATNRRLREWLKSASIGLVIRCRQASLHIPVITLSYIFQSVATAIVSSTTSLHNAALQRQQNR